MANEERRRGRPPKVKQEKPMAEVILEEVQQIAESSGTVLVDFEQQKKTVRLERERIRREQREEKENESYLLTIPLDYRVGALLDALNSRQEIVAMPGIVNPEDDTVRFYVAPRDGMSTTSVTELRELRNTITGSINVREGGLTPKAFSNGAIHYGIIRYDEPTRDGNKSIEIKIVPDGGIATVLWQYDLRKGTGKVGRDELLDTLSQEISAEQIASLQEDSLKAYRSLEEHLNGLPPPSERRSGSSGL